MNIKLAVIISWMILGIFAGGIEAQIQKHEPIIIKTPITNYEQPNFEDYKTCMKDLDSCKSLCHGVEECLAKCKKCPVLLQENIIVQGVNDTDYRTSSNVPINSTNFIRVTNEIHNVIENNLGGIHTNNVNNIYETNNPTCDKFGLGCNENGTCCYIVRNQQREKHCGQLCQARVMFERTVIQCRDETNPNSCIKIIEYKPLRSKRSKHVSDNYRCRYVSKWPYVYCKNRKPMNDRCSSICLTLSYHYILQNGIPSRCVDCFKSFGEVSKDNVPALDEEKHHAPPVVENDHNKFDPRDKEWVLEKTKCRLQDGTISENCATNDNEFGSGDDSNDIGAPALDDSQKRENEFRRSKYSLRYGRKLMENHESEN